MKKSIRRRCARVPQRPLPLHSRHRADGRPAGRRSGQGRQLRGRPDPHLRDVRDGPLRHHHQPRPLQHQGRHGARSTTTGKTGKVDITMDISSINTGVDLLNRHVLSKDFFNVAEFPTGRFVADKIDFNGDKVAEVDGTLTLLGQTRPGHAQGQSLQLLPEPADQAPGLRRRLRDHRSSAATGASPGASPSASRTRCELLVQVEAVNIVAAKLGAAPDSQQALAAPAAPASSSISRSQKLAVGLLPSAPVRLAASPSPRCHSSAAARLGDKRTPLGALLLEHVDQLQHLLRHLAAEDEEADLGVVRLRARVEVHRADEERAAGRSPPTWRAAGRSTCRTGPGARCAACAPELSSWISTPSSQHVGPVAAVAGVDHAARRWRPANW